MNQYLTYYTIHSNFLHFRHEVAIGLIGGYSSRFWTQMQTMHIGPMPAPNFVGHDLAHTGERRSRQCKGHSFFFSKMKNVSQL